MSVQSKIKKKTISYKIHIESFYSTLFMKGLTDNRHIDKKAISLLKVSNGIC